MDRGHGHTDMDMDRILAEAKVAGSAAAACDVMPSRRIVSACPVSRYAGFAWSPHVRRAGVSADHGKTISPSEQNLSLTTCLLC
mmetsp:Transcript_69123/g.154202  ORF Transcript_69123/g.154202 Transcript_69123/m.154202 type:complete len:84 (+) Transcript_69123:361-612(+)